jgi:hypothetical protein
LVSNIETSKMVVSLGDTIGFAEDSFTRMVSPTELVIGDHKYELPPETDMVVVSPRHIEVSIDEFPTTSLKKSTNTESIPVQVSLVVRTVNQLGTLGTEVGFELVGLFIIEEEVHT